MLVVLDELVEQSLFQQAKSWPKSSATSLPNLAATIYPEEDLVVLSMAGHKPDFSGGGANISLACYGYQPSAGVIPSLPSPHSRGNKSANADAGSDRLRSAVATGLLF